MTLEQINKLRETIKSKSVIWKNFGDAYEIKDVPIKMCDPDNTGVYDHIAIIEDGHIDLGNADAEDFYTFASLFDDLSVRQVNPAPDETSNSQDRQGQ